MASLNTRLLPDLTLSRDVAAAHEKICYHTNDKLNISINFQMLGCLQSQPSSQGLKMHSRKFSTIITPALPAEQTGSSELNVRNESPVVFQNFPWDKFFEKLVQQLASLCWSIGKFVGVPLLMATAIGDTIFTISAGKELLIPVGLLTGTVLAGVSKETAIALGCDFQDGAIPWHLLGIGLLLALVKVSAARFPLEVCAFSLHVANGGLWQTFRYASDWRRGRAEGPMAEAAIQG